MKLLGDFVEIHPATWGIVVLRVTGNAFRTLAKTPLLFVSRRIMRESACCCSLFDPGTDNDQTAIYNPEKANLWRTR